MVLLNLADNIYKNSIYMIFTRLVSVSCGFFFWIIAARYYSIEDVGLGTSMLASMHIILMLSTLGFDFSIIRFFPKNQNILTTCLIITAIMSFILGVAYVLFISIITPDLAFIQESKYFVLFIIFIVLNTLATMTGRALLSARRPENYFGQNLFLSLRLLFLVPFVQLGQIGIFSSCGTANLLGTFYSFYILKDLLIHKLKLNLTFIKESFNFSLANYASNVFLLLPAQLLPLMILGLLGKSEVAKFYIPFTLGNMISIFSTPLATSLFVEGSYGGNFKKAVIKTFLSTYILVIPTITFIYFFGKPLLNLFGENYIQSFQILRIISVSGLLVPLQSLFITILNIKLKISFLIQLSVIYFISSIIFSYIFTLNYGITGTAYAWVLTYLLQAISIILIARWQRWI